MLLKILNFWLFLSLGPFKIMVILKPHPMKHLLEQLPDIVIVRILVKLQRHHIVEVTLKLLRHVRTQPLLGRLYLQLLDPHPLLLMLFSLDPLPWQFPLKQEHQHVPYGLKIVPS